MSFWYLASPYSHPDAKVRELRYHTTMSATAWLLMQKKWVYSPIVHCHEMALAYALPTDAEFWKDYNLAVLSAAAGVYVLMMDGWKESRGVKMELIWAIEQDKSIVEIMLGDESDMRIPWKFGPGKYFIK